MTLTTEEVAAFFTDTRVDIANNPRLREPQVDGHAAAVAHFAAGGGQALEQIPVGCGKSGLITLLPFGIAKGRVLVIAPNLTIPGLRNSGAAVSGESDLAAIDTAHVTAVRAGAYTHWCLLR